MKVQELFQKNIKRNINGVIQAGQLDEQSIFDELDEYVVTEEMEANLETFYRNYFAGLKEPVTKMGCWISGFFGSGKSHLLKILSYLLCNCVVRGKRAEDFFREKDIRPELLELIVAAARGQSDALLFNIDSKSATGAKNEKQKIVDVFLKVFNEHLGYSSTAWIAEIERQLDHEGRYGEFKQSFIHGVGKSWEVSRDYILLNQKSFIRAMQSTGYGEEEARTFLKGMKDTYEMNSEKLAKLIARYCRERGKNYRLIFLVDEVGQYIGDNRELMLNLQTVVEDLGNYAGGQVWVIVTSQEKIDAVTKVRGDDFSKIQGRFATRLNLSSANTDEVIKRRLLAKKEIAAQTLQLHYESREQSLRNMLSFDSNTGAFSFGYKSAEDFVSSYPFVGYQFDLLQKVFEKIRKQGEAGKHLAHGERSLLNAFQEVAVALDKQEIGCLATFAKFYGTLENFLDSSVKSTIRKAKNKEGIDFFDLDVLRTLYMIKGIEGFPASLDNITTLLLDSLDAVKNETWRRVERSLQKLTRHVLIHQNADRSYTFLSDEEQEINQEIKSTPIDSDKVMQKDISGAFYEYVYSQSRYRYSSVRDFDFNRKFNSYTRGVGQHSLTLQVYTGDITVAEASLNASSGILVMRLPEDGPGFIEPFEYSAKIDQFLNRKGRANLTKNQERILDQKRSEIGEFEEKGREALKEAASQATFYIEGQPYSFTGEPAAQIDRAFEVLVRNTFTKLHYIDYRLDVKNAAKIIKEWADKGVEQHLDGTLPNQLAHNEVLDYLEERQRGRLRPTLKSLAENFSGIPFGWGDWDMAGVVTLLVVGGKIKLSYLGERFNAGHPDFMTRLTRPAEREKVLVELEVAIPPDVRKRLTKIMRDYFGHHTLGDTYEDVAAAIRSKIKENMQQPLAEIQQRHSLESADYPYPGAAPIMHLESLVELLLAAKGDEQLINQLFDTEDQLEDWFDSLEDLKSFYLKKAIEHFDSAVQVLILRKTDLASATENMELQKVKHDIETILRMAEPYKQITRLPALLLQLQEGLEQLLAEERNKYRPQLQGIQLKVAELTAHYSAPGQYVDEGKIKAAIQQAVYSIDLQLKQFEETTSLTQLMAVPTLAQRSLEQLQEKLRLVIKKENTPDDKEEGILEVNPGGKEKKVIILTDLLFRVLPGKEMVVENELQLQQMLDDIHKELSGLIKSHILVLRK